MTVYMLVDKDGNIIGEGPGKDKSFVAYETRHLAEGVLEHLRLKGWREYEGVVEVEISVKGKA